MESMNVQEMTDRLKRLYPRIKAPTKIVWDKAVKPLAACRLEDVTDDVAYDYLDKHMDCLLYTSPSPRDPKTSRMPSSA